LKDLFQFAEGLGAREPWLGYPDLTAARHVQHPERHFHNSGCLDVFQAAMRHRLAALYQSGMHPHSLAVPWVPEIADFTDIPNMGVVLLSCITREETTKVRTICCCSPSLYLKPVHEAQSVVETGSVDLVVRQKCIWS